MPLSDSSVWDDLCSQSIAIPHCPISLNDRLTFWFPGTTGGENVLLFLAMILDTEILICCIIYYYWGLISHMSLTSFSEYQKMMVLQKMEPNIPVSLLNWSVSG